MKRILFTLLSVGLLAGTADAALMAGTVFEANFTSGEGYSDGDVDGQPGFTFTQTAWDVADSAGTGSLENTSGGFQRAQFGGNSLSTQTIAIEQMILIEANGLNIASAGGGDTQVMRFGLSTGGGSGAALLAIGSQLTKNGSGDLFVENSAFGVDLGGRVDTGFNVGTDTFNYGVKLTAETAGSAPTQMYTIDHLINGNSILTETGITPGALTLGFLTEFGGFIQDQGGSLSLDSLKIAVIPEPGSAAMFLIAMLAFVARRPFVACRHR